MNNNNIKHNTIATTRHNLTLKRTIQQGDSYCELIICVDTETVISRSYSY